MAKFFVELDCNNAAFDPECEFGGPNAEVARLLREAAEKIEQGNARVPLRDSNGNLVGAAFFATDSANIKG